MAEFKRQAVTFDQMFDFTRATSKWVYDATGTLVEVPANEPAYQYDPVTGKALGLLIEEQRTNLMQWSEDATQGFVRDAIDGDYTVSANQITAPDGTVTADLLECVSGAGSNNGQYTLERLSTSIPQDSVRSHALYVKQATSRYITLAIHTSGSVNLQYSAVFDFENPSSPHLGNGWYRIELSRNSFSYNVSDISISFGEATGSEVGSAYIRGWQTEIGSFPTSYIPTSGSQVTRAADNCSRTLGAEFNAGSYTVIFEGLMPPPQEMDQLPMIAMGYSTGTGQQWSIGSKGGGILYNAFGLEISLSPSYPEGAIVKFAVSWDGSEAKVAFNGEFKGSTSVVQQSQNYTTLGVGRLAHSNSRQWITVASKIAIKQIHSSQQELEDLTAL